MIQTRLEEVEKRVAAACERAGRSREEVTLIAVSKTKPVSDIEEAYRIGVREFGENKVQELTRKIEELPGDINWHMIGHLQRNKVKYIAGKVALIHSVDSFRLAEEINIHAKKRRIQIPVLIEVNAAGEASKFGVSLSDAKELVLQAASLDGLSIRGLMTIAPFVSDPEENREVFRAIKQLSVDIASENHDNVSMDILSMGMTNDFEVAIEEGATMVRVGTAIFGERNYGAA